MCYGTWGVKPIVPGQSGSTGSEYVAQHKKIGPRKVKTYWFGSAKWFWPSIFPEAGQGTVEHNTCCDDWLDSLIGPSGLLLVVFHLFLVQVLVL